MSIYDIGDGVTLRHSVYDGDGDLTAATVALALVAPDLTETEPAVSAISTGVYESEEVVVDQAGLWTYTWTVTGAVNDVTEGQFYVAAPASAAWAELGDVYAITGQAVTRANLAQAQAVIEMHVNRTPAANAAIPARDRYWLKSAVAWQAAWLSEQTSFHGRSTFQIQVQDGVHHHLNGPHEVILSPLATRCIRNLSWFGGRSVSIRSTTENLAAPIAFNLEASDDHHTWQVLR